MRINEEDHLKRRSQCLNCPPLARCTPHSPSWPLSAATQCSCASANIPTSYRNLPTDRLSRAERSLDPRHFRSGRTPIRLQRSPSVGYTRRKDAFMSAPSIVRSSSPLPATSACPTPLRFAVRYGRAFLTRTHMSTSTWSAARVAARLSASSPQSHDHPAGRRGASHVQTLELVAAPAPGRRSRRDCWKPSCRPYLCHMSRRLCPSMSTGPLSRGYR